VFLAGWIVSAGAPDGFAAAALIACSGVAMGTQAAAARGLAPGMPTTYVTGTLTALLSELSALGGLGADWWRRAAIVLALGGGGALEFGLWRALFSVVTIVFLLLGGAIADRFSRRSIILANDLGSGVVVSAIAMLSATGTLRIEHLYAEALIFGATHAFFQPA